MKIIAAFVVIVAAIIPALLFGHGFIGISARWQAGVTLLIGVLGVAIGAPFFQTLNRLSHKKIRSSVLLIITCGLLSGLLTAMTGYVLGSHLWDWLRIRGDLEAYLWCIFFASITSGIIAIPFGAGLLQSLWYKN